ncbi:MAG: NADH-quinone oxidoreductase subunit J [Candidatus Eiseniibacteriota bacterium]|nr:MAG: NADH-quinone oxidoreductase subunit J [Candidatus Eisenbacteria bacterium]
MTALLFFVCSLVAIASAALVVSRKNPVHSVLFLIVCLLSVALLFLLLGAQFIAALQVIVYAGAIVVLFVFVLMLLNVKKETVTLHSSTVQKLGAVILVIVLLMEALFVAVMGVGWLSKEAWIAASGISFGTVQSIGRELFTRYLFQFEVASVLLLVAIVGAIAITKKR